MDIRTLKCRHGRPIDCECEKCEKEARDKEINILEAITGIPMPKRK